MTERERAVFDAVNRVVERHVYRVPTDVEGLCRLYGAALIPYAEAAARAGLDEGEIARAAGSSDGFTLDVGEGWAIVYNDALPPRRVRFTLAEELMHRLLLHSQDDAFLCARQSYSERSYALYEAEARRAAGLLLVPPTVYYRFRRREQRRALAELCAVSAACLRAAAAFYDANEEEIRAAFTKKRIVCALPAPRTLRLPRPRAVEAADWEGA